MTKNEKEIAQLSLEFLAKYESLSKTFAGAASKLDGLRQSLEEAKTLYEDSKKKWWIEYKTILTAAIVLLLLLLVLAYLQNVSKNICKLSFEIGGKFDYEQCSPIAPLSN